MDAFLGVVTWASEGVTCVKISSCFSSWDGWLVVLVELTDVLKSG